MEVYKTRSNNRYYKFNVDCHEQVLRTHNQATDMEPSPLNNEASVSTNANEKKADLLRDGPCSEQNALLQSCQQRMKIQKPSNVLTYCVSETDLLISCIRKNPAYFHTMRMKK
jgi:hypothetical protein